VEIKEEDLVHYGILRRSGRYPWGSGGTQNTRNKQFLDYVDGLKSQGLSESEIARGMGITTSELRANRSIARNQQRQADIAMAQRLHDKGYSNVAIGQRMGKNESTVRSLLAPGAKDKADVLQSTADMLRAQVDSKGFIDVGTGAEGFVDLGTGQTGVSSTRLKTAVDMLRAEGYAYHTVKVTQIGTGLETTVKVLAPPGTTQKDVFLNRDKIAFIQSFSENGGRSYTDVQSPLSINPSRLQVKFKEDGGDQADGVVFVRPGVKDVSLGGAKYAQVRIKVGDGHYIKGMAVYKDDLPDGVDLQFHTNKSRDTPVFGDKDNTVLKNIKDDPDLPFGTIVRQIGDNMGTPKARVTSAMNVVYDEGNWGEWNRTLSSQMLSKQSPALVKSQLDMTYESRKAQFDEIMGMTNPVVRKRLLEDFADGTDSAAVHLKAAALPRQGTHVILPLGKIDPTHVYAPNYENGTTVVLIRHPHGGPFEIPELKVNNRNAEGRNLLGNSRDAIGIHHSVAKRLSGADFDGDTVLVIPNNEGRVRTRPALKELEGFDPQRSYPGYAGMKRMTNTQTEMGKISNLITDMSLKGASSSEIARAVKHSMVVIDAEKHGLNYKLSYNDNGIKQLKDKYQQGGASTIISRAKSRLDVPDRKPRSAGKGGPIDRETGARVFEPTGRTNFRTGRPITIRSTKLGEARDAHTLSSGTPVERMYANHSNNLKALANRARLASVRTPTPKQSPSARKTYADEVASLDAKLRIAIRNRPLERQAQLIANATVRAKRDANPHMEPETLKKVKFQALAEARVRTGAGKQRINITDAEWAAIQANAISASKLNDILTNADTDRVRELAAPKSSKLMTSAKTSRAKSMLASGYTRAEVARALGVSLTTLDEATVD
jgi:DNA-binding CsgD family transcriptional regulator